MAGAGWQVNDILEAVSRALVEKTMNSTLAGSISSGTQSPLIVDPAIYVGAMLIVGYGTANQEIITVTAIGTSGFTATFAKNHNGGEVIKGCTFPSGQVNQYNSSNISSGATVAPLFTQAEILDYVRVVQADFLERTRHIYNVATVNFLTGNPMASVPADCIRVERADIGGTFLWPVSRTELDLSGTSAPSQGPTSWYQDKLDTGKIGINQTPPVNLAVEVIYSQKNTATPLLTDALFVNDIFWPALKYGVLEKCFNKEGETRDPRKAAICAKKYGRWVQFGQMLMGAIQVSPDFSRQQEMVSA